MCLLVPVDNLSLSNFQKLTALYVTILDSDIASF